MSNPEPNPFDEDGPEVEEISVAEARGLLDTEDVLFVDVRDPDSHEGLRIPGSLSVTDETVTAFLEATQRTRPLVVYCYHGYSSVGGAAYFMSQGFTRVYSLRGGFTAWEYENHPSEGVWKQGNRTSAP